jgi:translocator protein
MPSADGGQTPQGQAAILALTMRRHLVKRNVMQDISDSLILARSARSLVFMGIAILVVVTATFVGSSVTTPVISTWYAGLNKPWFNPPNIAFPIVWPLLFALMAFGFWRILRVINGGQPRRNAILAFFVQILFNMGWSFAFFGAKSPLAGLFVAAGLVLSVAAMVLTFSRVDRLAAWLQLPYLGWVTFAFVLNAAIWRIN